MGTLDEIVAWIEPQRGDWVVAVDAPLVVLNQTGRRQADADVSAKYWKFEAGAYPANLNNLNLGPTHQGRATVAGAAGCGADVGGARRGCEERPADAFEMYPHPAMVELFALERTIKYKKGRVAEKRIGQRELADAIRVHLCAAEARPRLRVDPKLEDLLEEPQEPLKGRALKGREDRLDAVVCAYIAAWLDAGNRCKRWVRSAKGW